MERAAHGGQEAVGGGVEPVAGRAVLKGGQRRGRRALLQEVPGVVERQPGRDAPPLHAHPRPPPPPAPLQPGLPRATAGRSTPAPCVCIASVVTVRQQAGAPEARAPPEGGWGAGAARLQILGAHHNQLVSAQLHGCVRGDVVHVAIQHLACGPSRWRLLGARLPGSEGVPVQVQHHGRHQSIACCQHHSCAGRKGCLRRSPIRNVVCHPQELADFVAGEAQMREWAMRGRALGD